MDNFIVILCVLAVVIPAAIYVIRAKKKGQKCIGCPSGGNCKKCSGGCHCEK